MNKDKNYNQIEISPIEFSKDGDIKVTLSKEMGKNINISPRSKNNKEVYLIHTGGSIQIATGKPICDIPVLTEGEEFMEQKY